MTDNTSANLFRKKPVVISAVQFTKAMAEGHESLPDGVVMASRTTDATGHFPEYANDGKYLTNYDTCHRHCIATLEGQMDVRIGDWVITGVQGEHYACKPEIFAATYEPASLPPANPGAVAVDVDKLANEIRRVDGSNSLGAGALAEALMPFLAAPSVPSAPADDTHAFKNFHRLLCERFDYCHDEKDWRRDQVSLIEHIARRISSAPDGEHGGDLDAQYRSWDEAATLACLPATAPDSKGCANCKGRGCVDEGDPEVHGLFSCDRCGGTGKAPAESGWQWVPKEPTEEMIRAGYDAENNEGKMYLRPAWRYMLAAAPQAVQAGGEGGNG